MSPENSTGGTGSTPKADASTPPVILQDHPSFPTISEEPKPIPGAQSPSTHPKHASDSPSIPTLSVETGCQDNTKQAEQDTLEDHSSIPTSNEKSDSTSSASSSIPTLNVEPECQDNTKQPEQCVGEDHTSSPTGVKKSDSLSPKESLPKRPSLQDLRARSTETLSRFVNGIPNGLQADWDDLQKSLWIKGESPTYLCSHCDTLDVLKCHSSVEYSWKIPLRRCIMHLNGCHLCTLIVQALSQPQNDPFKHERVWKYLPKQIGQGIENMKQWLDKHTYRTFMNEWPFGKGEVLDDGKDYVEGATHYAGNWSRQSANFVTARAAANFASTIVAFKGFDYFDEVRKLKLKKPLPCYLELRTNGLAPGLLDVKLWGYGGNPDPELKAGVLSEFRLRFETSNKGTHSQHQHPGRPSIAYGNNLHHARVHVEMGKAWLADCENHHGDTCRKRDSAITIRKPTFLRLVDVENYSVVELRGANADCRYLALSYVWGEKEKAAPLMLQESNKSLFTSKNGLKESFDTDMPKTLRDAIKTTKRMEERYIWIDSLCIQQDSEEEKKQQIKMMGRIYGNAIVTIVAADAADSNAGLGIDERTRKLEQVKQPVKEGIHLMLPLPKPMDLDESVWDTRKWTFQEKLLSRRLMIFMDGQVHWQCRKLLAFEDMTAQEKGLPLEYRESEWLNPSLQSAGIHTPRDIDINGSIKKSLGKTQIVRSLAFREYVKCVELYTSRQLAGYHDNLDPLTGLLQTLELCFRCQVVQGLPEIHLDAALLWQPGEKLTRSPKSTKGDTQPSWSWVGWDGKITYPKPFYVLDDDTGLKRLETKQGLEGFRPLVQWHTWKNRKLKLLNSTGLGIPLFVENANELPAEWEKIPPGSTALDGYYQSMKLHDLLYKARHSMRQKSKRDQKDKAIKSTRHSPSDQYLVFRTSCSKGISFGEPIQPAASPSPSNLQDGAEFSLAETPESNRPDRYQLLSTTTFLTIGEITLDSSTPSSFDPNKHTFLVLSEGHALLSGYEDDEYPYYNVMLVEQTEGKIAYRLGIGRVEKAAWMGTSPAPFLDWTILG